MTIHAPSTLHIVARYKRCVFRQQPRLWSVNRHVTPPDGR